MNGCPAGILCSSAIPGDEPSDRVAPTIVFPDRVWERGGTSERPPPAPRTQTLSGYALVRATPSLSPRRPCRRSRRLAHLLRRVPQADMDYNQITMQAAPEFAARPSLAFALTSATLQLKPDKHDLHLFYARPKPKDSPRWRWTRIARAWRRPRRSESRAPER